MIKQVLTTSLISLGIGYMCQLAQSAGESQYLNNFLKNNLITLLIALLAINSTTMGIVLTKIRDLIDKAPTSSNEFSSTKKEMLLSIKEQIGLIILAAALLTAENSSFVTQSADLKSVFSVMLCAIFSYSIINLYDNAKSVLIIIDY